AWPSSIALAMGSGLLPQLPFTWHHGWKRWRLFIFAFLVFVDASAVPIALYYGLKYAGDAARVSD
ncbi:hypothetical protein, partial [Escherichia coli]|uniref:hypothetical protein n=1 Tax=Escherichia coli TaxID=562 RepID=UPI0019531C46